MPCLPRGSEQVCGRTCESLSSERLRARSDNSKVLRSSRAEELAKAPVKTSASLVHTPDATRPCRSALPQGGTLVFTRHLSVHGVRLIAHDYSSRSTASWRAHRRTPSTNTQLSCSFAASTHGHPLYLALERRQRHGLHNRLRLAHRCSNKMPEDTS